MKKQPQQPEQQRSEDLAGASAVRKEAVQSPAAAATSEIASEEHFERWWKHHAINKRARTDAHLALLAESYREVAHAAWRASFGLIPQAHRDERIERLEERAQYLRTKIFNNRPAESAYAKAEVSALEWAIPIVLRATAAHSREASEPASEPNNKTAVAEALAELVRTSEQLPIASTIGHFARTKFQPALERARALLEEPK